MSMTEPARKGGNLKTGNEQADSPDDGDYGGHQFGCSADLADGRDQALIPWVWPEGSSWQQPLTADEVATHVTNTVPLEPGDSALLAWDGVRTYNQYPLRSCVSCAVAAVINYLEQTGRSETDIDPAALFLYYNARAMEGNADNEHAGTGIRTAIKALQRFGVCDETIWPYDAEQVTAAPGPGEYLKAEYRRRVRYHRVFRLPTRSRNGIPDLSELDLEPVRRALANDIPVICGFTVYPSFKNAKSNGLVQFPEEINAGFESNRSEEDDPPELTAEGAERRTKTFGHAAVIIGFDRNDPDYAGEASFTLVNSWGEDWGFDRGKFKMPASYLANAGLASDFWTITSLTATRATAGAPQEENRSTAS